MHLFCRSNEPDYSEEMLLREKVNLVLPPAPALPYRPSTEYTRNAFPGMPPHCE